MGQYIELPKVLCKKRNAHLTASNTKDTMGGDDIHYKDISSAIKHIPSILRYSFSHECFIFPNVSITLRDIWKNNISLAETDVLLDVHLIPINIVQGELSRTSNHFILLLELAIKTA